MGYQIINIYFFVSVIITIYLGASIRYKKGNKDLSMIAPLTLLMTIYVYGYSHEIMVNNYSDAYFWNTFQYLAIPLISPVWLHIGMVYTGLMNKHKRVKLLLLYGLPTMSIIIRLSNPLHKFYFSDMYGIVENNRFLLIQEKGPGFLIQLSFALLTLAVTLGVYVYGYRNKHYVNLPIIRYMTVATVFSTTALILKTVDLLGLHLDYLAIVMPINVISLYLAIFRHDFFEIQDLAFAKAFDNSSDSMIILDNYYSVVDYNSEAVELFKSLDMKLEKKRLQEIVKENYKTVKELLDPEDSTVKVDVNGEAKYYNIHSNKIFNNKNIESGRLYVIRDMTNEHQLHETLLYNATTDDLSGLLNRRSFIEESEKLCEDINNHMLLMMDIDFFKKVNDTYGHNIGDMVIKGVGRKLKEYFDSAAIIGRVGGEEFAVFIEYNDFAEARSLVNGFRMMIENTEFVEGEVSVKVTISIGLCATSDEVDFGQIMIKADKALYGAKNSGRNKVYI